MIVFCCGMSRSGSTVQYQIAKRIVESKGVGTGRGHFTDSLKQELMDAPDNHLYIIKSEQCWPWMKHMLTLNMAVGIGIYRDFRDVVASLMWFYSMRAVHLDDVSRAGTFKEVSETTAKQALLWQSAWEVLPNVTFMRYESLWPNLSDMTEWVADKLDVALSQDEIRAIKEQCTLENNKHLIEEQDAWIDLDGDMFTKAHISPCNGRPGRYSEVLDEAQIRKIDRIGGRWLRSHGYNVESKS